MSSKKEEERNEKIIRGLMKLPPNRRCINCNSLGPQYVCTNFWTFICITCSGIHREFTHRVKSVSMAKFTSQEVDSLQRGGNQRAREIYLKDWDIQRQRLPSSGNVENVREFIKNVYVDKKYAGGNTAEKPPRNLQSLRNQEDDTRRASSYHSYSQSPPYESQYEDRKYGRVLTRRPGSDRGHYEGKLSSFFSPGRSGEQYEDRFANEGSVSRASDYSVSSAGDPFRSDTQSPNFQKDVRVNSPGNHPVRDISREDAQRQVLRTQSDANAKKDAERIAHPHSQRTASASSFGSFDSNSISHVASEHEQTSRNQLDRLSSIPSVPQSHVSANNASVDFFSPSYVQQSAAFSAPAIDLFQSQATSSTPPIDLFADINRQHLTTTSKEHKQPALTFADNEGWATFDLPQHETSAPNTEKVPPAGMAPSGAPFGHFDQIPSTSINASMQWPSVHSSTTTGSFSSLDNQWHAVPQPVQTATDPTATMTWNAFEDSPDIPPQASFDNLPYTAKPQVPAYKPPPNADPCLKPEVSKGPVEDILQRANLDSGPHVPNSPANGDAITESVFTPSVFPLVGEMPSHAIERKSTNPFDFLDEPNDMFLDMSTLRSTLPDPQLQPAFLDDLTQPWFAQTSYVPPTAHGGLAYMAGETPAPQMPNLTPQGPVASLGGNPFA